MLWFNVSKNIAVFSSTEMYRLFFSHPLFLKFAHKALKAFLSMRRISPQCVGFPSMISFKYCPPLNAESISCRLSLRLCFSFLYNKRSASFFSALLRSALNILLSKRFVIHKKKHINPKRYKQDIQKQTIHKKIKYFKQVHKILQASSDITQKDTKCRPTWTGHASLRSTERYNILQHHSSLNFFAVSFNKLTLTSSAIDETCNHCSRKTTLS